MRGASSELKSPINSTSSSTAPRHESTEIVVDNEGNQAFQLASSLSSRRNKIEAIANSDEARFEAALYPEEITALYRRLPLKTEFHDWQLSPSIQLLMVMQECMKYAYKEKKSAASNSSANVWDFHIQFIDTLFPIFDALADLEEMINREDKNIDDLFAALKSYDGKVSNVASALEHDENNSIHYKHNDRYKEDVAHFLTAIKADLTAFQVPMYLHGNKATAFLSNYKIDPNINPLGFLIVDQVRHVATLLRRYRRAYEEFSGQYDYVEPPEDYKKIRVLDDKLSFRASLAFVRFSTAKPIPEDNIRILRAVGSNSEYLVEEEVVKKKSIVDLTQFIDKSKIHDFNTLEKLLCAISGRKPLTVGYTSTIEAVGFILALTVATFFEVAVTLARLALSNILLGLLASVVSFFIDVAEFFSAEHTHDFREYGEIARSFLLELSDKKIQGVFHQYSLLGNLRKLRDKGQREYYQTSMHAGIDAEHDGLLENFSSKPKSSLSYIAASYLSASFVNSHIRQGYQSFFSFFSSGMPEYLYEKFIRPCFAAGEADDAFFERLILQSRLYLSERSRYVNSVTGKLSLLAQTNAPDELGSDALVVNAVTPAASEKFSVLCANPVGPSVSIIDFIELIILEFCAFINSLFVTLPLPSTISLAITFFAISSFYMEWGGVAAEFFRHLIDSLSKSFTGEEASVSDMRIMLGSFLFWKLGVLAIESFIALISLDPHFLEKIYGDPEKALLIVATFTALGYGLHALPLFSEEINLLGLLPIDLLDTSFGVYLGMLNVIIEEARVAALEGQFPFNLLELFFLGLKAVLFLGSLVSGQHNPYLRENLEKLEDLIQEISGLMQTDDISTSHALVAAKIVQLHDALGKPLDRKDARRLFDFIAKHDNQATQSLRKDLYNQSIFRGSNNFLQLFFIYPLYPITISVRAVTYVLAKYLNAHSILHGIQKDFSAEAVMASQIPAALIENFRSAVLAFNQFSKNLSALGRVIASFVNNPFECFLMDAFEAYNREVLDKRDWHDQIITACKKGPVPLETGYGVVAHIANTDSVHQEHDESHVEGASDVIPLDVSETGSRKRPLTSCASAFSNCYAKTVGACTERLAKSWKGVDVANAMHARTDSADTEMGSVVSAGAGIR